MILKIIKRYLEKYTKYTIIEKSFLEIVSTQVTDKVEKSILQQITKGNDLLKRKPIDYKSLKEVIDKLENQKLENQKIIDRNTTYYLNNLITTNEARNLYRNNYEKGLFNNCEISL